MTLKHWGADPRGEWTLSVHDTVGNAAAGELVEWTLILHGAATDPGQEAPPRATTTTLWILLCRYSTTWYCLPKNSTEL